MVGATDVILTEFSKAVTLVVRSVTLAPTPLPVPVVNTVHVTVSNAAPPLLSLFTIFEAVARFVALLTSVFAIAVVTNCVVANCVVFVPSVAVGANGAPVYVGLAKFALSSN